MKKLLIIIAIALMGCAKEECRTCTYYTAIKQTGEQTVLEITAITDCGGNEIGTEQIGGSSSTSPGGVYSSKFKYRRCD